MEKEARSEKKSVCWLAQNSSEAATQTRSQERDSGNIAVRVGCREVLGEKPALQNLKAV
jgi:hypothetical protein